MTLDEAIKRYADNAEYERTHGNLQGCLEFRQFTEWLKDYKRLKEQEPCDDAISRQAAIDAVTDLCKHYTPTKSVYHPHMDFVIEALQDLPSVKPQPKTGHWEWVQYDSNPNIGNWHCSECRSVVVEYVDKKSKGGIPLYKYCPQCGCRIVEPQESEVSE